VDQQSDERIPPKIQGKSNDDQNSQWGQRIVRASTGAPGVLERKHKEKLTVLQPCHGGLFQPAMLVQARRTEPNPE
jgi:hypothetical protein